MHTESSRELAENNTRAILDWLAVAHGRTRQEEAQGLQRQLLSLRSTPLPTGQRLKLLDLLYDYAARITSAQLPTLHEASLPVSQKIRQLVRAIQDLLEILAQDYLNTLADLFDPAAPSPPSSHLNALARAMQCLHWHLTIGHLVAAPVTAGIWQQFHSTFQTARRFGLDNTPQAGRNLTVARIYLSSLLVSVAHPASFTSKELEFISLYIEKFGSAVKISEDIAPGQQGVFWIDPERDAPPNALARRIPPPETLVYFFACDTIAKGAADHLRALSGGKTASELGLPAFATTHGGQGVLKRLSNLWGRPAKRKFPRRRQSYRANLYAGLNKLWELFGERMPTGNLASEWMITNESPDGYAMMHVSGTTEQLCVGDIVAVLPRKNEKTASRPWQVCIVRWALSENPEHIELGLQALAVQAIAAKLVAPLPPGSSGPVPALLLPEAAPLRPSEALIVPTGAIADISKPLIVLIEQSNVAIRELRAAHFDEQNSCIEMISLKQNEKL